MRTMYTVEQVEEIRGRLEGAAAEDIVGWVTQTFGDRAALASSFGAEDMVVLDMMMRLNPAARVLTLDTGRLPQETHDLIDAVRERYGANVQVYAPDAGAVEEIVGAHGPNLFYKNVELRKLCCHVRKTVPLRRSLAGLDAWITGLRREQAPTRTQIHLVERDEANGGLVKVNPLATWTWDQVWEYLRAHEVPYNALHDRGYPSIGCGPCTRAVRPGEDLRAGRWWWEQGAQKECGLHVAADRSHASGLSTGGAGASASASDEE